MSRPDVDAAFGELVGMALRHRGSVADEVIRALGSDVGRVRTVCARGESELERHWAERVAAADRPWSELASFPYAQNYDDLVDLELSIVRGLGGAPCRIVMIGSGPLPLTGIRFACRHRVDTVLVDRDPDSSAEGEAVVHALGLSGRIASVCADAGRDDLDLRDADLVVHGALVGVDADEKHAMLAALSASMRPGAQVVIRSAAGLRALLYPPVAVDAATGLATQVEVHPHHDVVNSIVVARRE